MAFQLLAGGRSSGTFNESTRKTDQNLFEIIQLKKLNERSAAVTATMVGFGADEVWEKAYQFFVKGNTWPLE